MPRVGEKTSKLCYLGVDPGVSGGLAVVGPDCVDLFKMPATDVDLWRLVEEIAADRPIKVAVLEQVTGYVGGSGNTGSSMFKFGTSYGAVRMALVGVGIPFFEVGASVWQRKVGVPRRGKDVAKATHKNNLREFAQRLFPKASGITKATCDALLIAEYARRSVEGGLL